MCRFPRFHPLPWFFLWIEFVFTAVVIVVPSKFMAVGYTMNQGNNLSLNSSAVLLHVWIDQYNWFIMDWSQSIAFTAKKILYIVGSIIKLGSVILNVCSIT